MAIQIQLDDGGGSDADEGGGQESIVSEINITPLTDVFLVLLIIFMVTSTAMVESESAKSGVKVVLPKANAAGPVSQKRTDPVLTVTKGNEIYIGTKKVDVNALEAEIRKALQAVGSDTLLIRGDKNVLLGAAVDIMSTAKRAGASHIAILTAPGAQGSSSP